MRPTAPRSSVRRARSTARRKSRSAPSSIPPTGSRHEESMTTATTFGRPTLTGNVVFIGDSQFTKGLGGPLETDLDIPTVVGKILNAPGITIHNKAVGGATSVGTVQNLE